MNWWGSGFIAIVTYGIGTSAFNESFALITENGSNNIFTENGLDIDIEH